MWVPINFQSNLKNLDSKANNGLFDKPVENKGHSSTEQPEVDVRDSYHHGLEVSTMEPCFTVTLLLRPLFLSWRNAHTVSHKKTPLMWPPRR